MGSILCGNGCLSSTSSSKKSRLHQNLHHLLKQCCHRVLHIVSAKTCNNFWLVFAYYCLDVCRLCLAANPQIPPGPILDHQRYLIRNLTSTSRLHRAWFQRISWYSLDTLISRSLLGQVKSVIFPNPHHLYSTLYRTGVNADADADNVPKRQSSPCLFSRMSYCRCRQIWLYLEASSLL